jgi:Arc/MetJ family transcription regulator
MSRTNIDLDDDLVAEAMRRFDLPTKRSAVEFALRRLLATHVDADFLRSIEGIGWDGDLDEMRSAMRAPQL